jgi:hypothetical protein
MNLNEQIYRSRKLMVENHEDRLSLVNDILNDFLSFDGHIQYTIVPEPFSDEVFNFSVEATIDSAMYHMVSPDYNPKYEKYVTYLDNEIQRLIDRYFGDDVMFEVMVYFHKNVEKVISLSKPMLDKAMRVYSQQNHKPVLKFKFLSTQRRPEIVIQIEHNKEIGESFSHREFMEVLNSLYYDRQGFGLFDDFYITGILGFSESGTYLNKMYESVENNKVTCDECGWSWDLSDGGDDPYTCHKCGHENKNPHD